METRSLARKEDKLTVTFEDVKNYLCPNAASQEISLFLKTSQSMGLNPFAREIYLIKYGADQPAAIVIAIDAFLKASESNKQYDGHEAGIIIKPKDGIPEFREGTFMVDSDGELAGGWAKVYRKDRGKPFYSAVNMKEYLKYTRDGKVTRFWREMPATKIRNVALKHSLKEAFPNLFSGLYTEAEFEPVPEGEVPPAFEKNGKLNWQKFWAKAKKELGIDSPKAHELFGVNSIKEDIIESQGKTLEEVFDMLVELAKSPESDKVSANQIKEIKELMIAGNYSKDEVVKFCQDKFNVDNPVDLTTQQADDLIAILKANEMLAVSQPEQEELFPEERAG